MTRTVLSCCALALALALASFPARGAIQLRLQVEPQSQLPAIEPSLRVEAVNTGSAPVELPVTIALQVIPPGDRKPFIAYTGLRGNDRVTWLLSGDDAAVVLAPKETRDLSFWAGPESPVWFAADSRLLSPGTYRFQLVAHPKLDSDLLDDVERVVDQPGLIDPIVSNEATYTVETPRGEDAVVWELIQHRPKGTFWRDALGEKIWKEHPTSRYAAFCIEEPSTNDDSAFIAAYNAALEKRPSASWADWFRLNIAQHELSRSQTFISKRDVDAACDARNRARAILTQLEKDALPPYVRKTARQLLDTHSWSREEIIRYIKDLNGELRETRPFAVCVEKQAGGKHVFWFGYDNTTREPMTIPVGPDNKFTPPPFDRGQPTIFPAHETVLGLRVVTSEPSVTWHLQDYNVQASIAKTEPCPPDFQERYTYVPPRRE